MLPSSWRYSRSVFSVHYDEGLLIVLRTRAAPCRLSFGTVAEGASVSVDSVMTLVVNHSTLRSDAKHSHCSTPPYPVSAGSFVSR